MKQKLSYFINVQAILFMLFLFITSYFNRFAVDDYHFIGALKTTSFEEIYSHLYFHWHGRWASNFLLLYFLEFNQSPFFLVIFNILSFILLYAGVVRLFKSINQFYRLQIENKVLLTYGLIFISVLFFCTVTPNETWFWYTSSVVYFWSTIAFFFGFNIFFKQHKSIMDYILFGLSASYIGGSNEPLTLLIYLAFFWLLIKKKHFGLVVTGLLIISSAFLINYLSKGTLHRDEITPNLTTVNLVLYTGYSTAKFFLFSFYKTFIPALFLSLPFYLLGKKVDKSLLPVDFKPLKSFSRNLIIIIATVFINQLVVVYALGGLSPDRSGIASSIVISLVLVRYLFLLGIYHHQKYSSVNYILILNILFLVGFNVFYYHIHKSYAKAVDERIEYIKKADDKTIYVKALPHSGYIYSAEITADTTNFKNIHLKEGLGLKGNVIVIH